MFRKPKKGTLSKFRTNKKRNHDDDDDDNKEEGDHHHTTTTSDDDDHQQEKITKKRFRKRSSSSSDEEDNVDGERREEENGIGNRGDTTSKLLQQIKNEKQKKMNNNSINNKSLSSSSSSFMHEYKTSEKQLTQQDLATLHAQHHPLTSQNSDDGNGVLNNDDNDNNEIIEKPKRNKFLAGPIKASKFIRTTSRFDYQPDICKDYKETGFCGFGDTCIYLHDRTNTKTGFALEQEWEEKKKREQEEKEREMDLFCKEVSGVDDHDDFVVEDDGLPFACHLCRDAFKEPVITSCNHYFCQSCILQRLQQDNNPSCPICNQDTNGVFNYPTKLVTKRKKLVGRKGTWEEFKDFMKNKS